jgi:hypothetical protein
LEEGSPPTSPQGVTDLDNFTVVECGRRSTPIHAAVPLVAVTSPTTTGNSFGILDDAPPPATHPTNLMDAAATSSNDALYKAICASQPYVATILSWQEQFIQAIDNKWTVILWTFQLQQNDPFTGLLNTMSAQVKTQVETALNPITLSVLLLDSMVKAVKGRFSTKIDD